MGATENVRKARREINGTNLGEHRRSDRVRSTGILRWIQRSIVHIPSVLRVDNIGVIAVKTRLVHGGDLKGKKSGSGQIKKGTAVVALTATSPSIK